MKQAETSLEIGSEQEPNFITFDDDDRRQLFLRFAEHADLPITDLICYYDLQYDAVAIHFSCSKDAVEELETFLKHCRAIHWLSSYRLASQVGALYARFSGILDPSSGALVLQMTFLGQGQRFHFYHHRSKQILACQYTPLAIMMKQSLYDTSEGPFPNLVKDDLFTILVFEQGGIISATTYQFDGVTLVEKSRIGKSLIKQCTIQTPPF